MLTVVKIGWRECADTSRLESVLTYALHGLEYRAVDGAAFAEVCRSAAALPAGRKLYLRLPEKVQAVTTPALVLASLVLCTASLVDASYNPFLYFRF